MIFGKLIAAAVLATMVLAKKSTPEPTLFEAVTRYTASWTRGLYTGFEIGYFHAPANMTLNKDCLGNDWQNLFVETFTGYQQTHFTAVNFTVNSLFLFTSMQNECQFNTAFYRYMTYCYENYQCHPYTMFQTLVAKVFQVTSIVNDMAQLIAGSVPSLTDTQQVVQTYASHIGMDLGKILRLANNFNN